MSEKINKNEGLMPFNKCGWIWYEKPGKDDLNSYMLARKEFTINKIPSKAEIKITADSRYKLYVNGFFVSYGPARGFPEHYPFDRIDISQYLKKGKNVLSVVVHQFGISTHQSFYAGKAGLIVSGKISGIDIGTKRKNWLVKKCPGHKKDTVRRSKQMGFQEYFDARLVEPSWMLPEADIKPGNDGWTYPEYWEPATHSFEERDIPLLGYEIKNFKDIIGIYIGNMFDKWETCKNLTTVYFNEMSGEKTDEIKKPENILTEKGYAEILHLPEGKRLTFILDVGEESTGFIGIEAESEKGVVVDFTSSELIKNGFVYVEDPEKTDGTISISDRFILREGFNKLETFNIHGFRYLAVTIRNVRKKLRIHRIYIRRIFYPFQKETHFECSDEKINNIWKMCVRTQKNCSLDAFVDCPWREQAQWLADARIQGINTYFMFNETRLFKRAIRQCGESQAENGLTFGVYPCDKADKKILPDFTLIWIKSHLDYFRFSGDKELLELQFQRIEKTIEFFMSYTRKYKLLPPMPEYWLFLDWATLYKEGFSAVFNLIYLSALKDMIEVCKILSKNSNIYQKELNILRENIIKFFWSEKEKVFYDGFDFKENKQIKKISQHTHSLAILNNLKPEFHIQFCERVLIPPMKKPPLTDKEIVEASPYFYFYVIEALKKVGGYEKTIIEFIKTRWGSMIEQGSSTCWEMWNPAPGRTSLCHAWSAHPSVHFINIAGIFPVSPNWKKFLIGPYLLETDMINLKIPVENDYIEIFIKRDEEHILRIITIPYGITCLINFDGQEKVLSSGRHILKTSQ